MFIRSRIVGLILLGLAVATAGALAEGFGIQGTVKGPDGRPVSGAEVRAEGKAGKSVAKTNAKGVYVFKQLASGIYTVTTWVNKVPTSVANVRTRDDGAVRVDFDIKPTAQASKKKAKHMVWVPASTGTNIGGRWVEVDDNGVVPMGDRVDNADLNALRRQQGIIHNSAGGR